MKLLVYIITVIFLLQSVTGAVPILVENVPAMKKDIFIPESYGIIEKSSFDDYLSSRLVVLVKDAHCNYDAQHNIARILEVLVRDYKIDLVAVEGAAGILDFKRFWKLENEPAREKMADTFVKKGVLSGPEYLAISKDGKLTFNIYGIEDERLYVENFTTFRQTIDHIEETELFVNEVSRVIKHLKQKIYPKELLEFDNKAGGYYENDIPLTDWVKELNKEADRLGFILKEYPNVSLTIDSIALENQVDFKKVELERAGAIANLEKILSKDGLKEMVEKSLRFRLGKIASSDYYKYLEELLNSISASAESFPNLMKYIELVKFQSWINNDALFSEIGDLEDRIKETMFQDNIQRELNSLSKRVRILDNLFKLTLNRDDLGYYMGHKGEFLPSNILSFINIQAPLHNIPVSMLLSNEGFLRIVTGVISSGEKFYYIAVERDVSLVENTLRVMEEKKKSSAIMVIGGFHTDGVLNLFETKGIGYLVVTPKIVRAEKEGLYLSLMMDKRIQPPPQTSSLAPLKVFGDGNRLVEDLRAALFRSDVLDAAVQTYNRFAGKKAPEGPVLPFNITVSEDKVTVAINPDFRDEGITPQLMEWFRKGLEEVLNQNPGLRKLAEDKGEAYLNKSVLLEYKSHAGPAAREGILRRYTVGSILFYLAMAKAYEEGGLMALPEGVRASLPESIRSQEARNLPDFKKELVSKLKEKGITEDIADTVANYLFTMPAYSIDESKMPYQMMFFNSYIELLKGIVGEELEPLLNRLRVYRYLQSHLAALYEVTHEPLQSNDNIADILKTNTGKRVEVLARYIVSDGVEFSEHADEIGKILGRKLDISKRKHDGWVAEVISISKIRNEDTILDPMKRDLYVATLLRTGEMDLDLPKGYRDRFSNFEKRLAEVLGGELPTTEKISEKKDRVIIRACSLYISNIEEEGDYFRYTDLSDLGMDKIKDVQDAKIPQYFLYEKEAEKELMKRRLRERGIEFIEDQFRHKDEFENIPRGRVTIVMLTSQLAEGLIAKGKEGKDRFLIGNEEGSDIMLMDRASLFMAERDEIVLDEIRDLFRTIFREYYMGSRFGEREIGEFIEKNIFIDKRGIFRIILPPITPFIREYYNMLLRARETISKAA